MPRKIFYPEQIIAKLRKIYALIGHAQPVIQAVRAAGISEQSDYHWCYEYGGNGLSRPGASRFLSAIRSLHTHQQFGILRNHDMRIELYYP